MSTAPEWFDPVTGQPLAAGDAEPGSTERAERAERAARADAAVTAARAARASLGSSTAGAAGALLAPAPGVDLDLDHDADTDTDDVAAAAAAAAQDRYSTLQLGAGILGRIILAFVSGCLAVSLLPLLVGWHPYVVKSGSMEPRITVGDVVLASPDHDARSLLGHVTVFTDPARPDQVKSHRVIAVNPDGSLTTKGDANPTADPVPVSAAQVRGIGRLLVRGAGLPLVWTTTGQYLRLALMLLVLLGAALAVARDHEDEDEDEDEEPDGRPDPVDGRQPRSRRRRARMARATVGLAGAGALLVPGASAAFSATTKSTAASWTVPAYSYPTAVTGYSPYLYWKLGEASGNSAADASGNGRTGTYTGGAAYTRGVTGGTPDTSPNAAVTATTSTACITTTSTTAISAPAVFTLVTWFKTTSGYAGGGKLIGFEAPRTGVAASGLGGSYDRHIYLDGAGKVWFGVYNAANQTISTSSSYNDGSWHMAAATLGAAGMKLYVDGVLRASSSNAAAEATTGWWRVGCGNLSGWGTSWTGANNPGTITTVAVNVPFLGSLDEAAVFSGSALTAGDIGYLYWTR